MMMVFLLSTQLYTAKPTHLYLKMEFKYQYHLHISMSLDRIVTYISTNKLLYCIVLYCIVLYCIHPGSFLLSPKKRLTLRI